MVAQVLGRTPRAVWVAAALAACLHLAFLGAPLGTDEGGFALVARYWNHSGAYLYGPLWVDRPPGLFVVFAAAVAVGPHVVAAVCGATLVLATAASASALGGSKAAVWAAWAALAFSSSVFLSAQQLNGELVAATLISLGIALLVSRASASTAFVAGIAMGSAVLVKQNFIDGAVFGVVLLGQQAFAGHAVRRRAAVFAAGGAVTVAAAFAWTSGRGGPGALLYAMYGFRLDANRVLAGTLEDGPDALRGLGFALASGILLALVASAWSLGRTRPRPSPVGLALTAAVAVEVIGIVLGGSWWPHYFIALAPTAALAAGLLAGRGLMRAVVIASVATAVIATPFYAVQVHATTSPDRSVARWLKDNAVRGDSGLVTFTHVNVLEMADLRPAYPFDWSLPVRVRDPRLTLMVATISGPTPPTWVVRWDPANEWGLDPGGRVQSLLSERYRQVATICGHAVWLLADQQRTLVGPTRAC